MRTCANTQCKGIATFDCYPYCSLRCKAADRNRVGVADVVPGVTGWQWANIPSDRVGRITNFLTELLVTMEDYVKDNDILRLNTFVLQEYEHIKKGLEMGEEQKPDDGIDTSKIPAGWAISRMGIVIDTFDKQSYGAELKRGSQVVEGTDITQQGALNNAIIAAGTWE